MKSLLFCFMWFIGVMGFIACQSESHQHPPHGHANHFMHQRPFEELVASFEDSSRLAWQKPESVISLMGQLEGKEVMDIGCGTGYFAFRLLDFGAKVICADVDDRFLDYVAQKREDRGIDSLDLKTKKVPYESPRLGEGTIDMVITVNTYHHIENRTSYFNEVKSGLRPGGKLMVVDFFKRELPEGPPLSMKLSAQEVEEELMKAGFTQFDVYEDVLPYQYIILAS